MSEHVDVIVIGLGVAGEEVAGRLAEAGLSVVGVEAGLVGGECPYWGCVPTKMMIRASGIIGEVGRAGALAGRATIEPDWSLVAQRIRAEATDTWDDQVAATGSRAKAVASCAVTGASRDRARSRSATGYSRLGAVWCLPPAPPRSCLRSAGFPGCRSGQTATRCRRISRRRRCW